MTNFDMLETEESFKPENFANKGLNLQGLSKKSLFDISFRDDQKAAYFTVLGD